MDTIYPFNEPFHLLVLENVTSNQWRLKLKKVECSLVELLYHWFSNPSPRQWKSIKTAYQINCFWIPSCSLVIVNHFECTILENNERSAVDQRQKWIWLAKQYEKKTSKLIEQHYEKYNAVKVDNEVEARSRNGRRRKVSRLKKKNTMIQRNHSRRPDWYK